MSKPIRLPITVFVCTSCRLPLEGEVFERPGAAMAAELARKVAAAGADDSVHVEPIECLAVCKRPVSVALAGEGRFTYVIGDLDPGQHLDDVVAAARAYAATDNGIVPWRERPQTFRKGVVARIPPLGFKQPDPAP